MVWVHRVNDSTCDIRVFLLSSSDVLALPIFKQEESSLPSENENMILPFQYVLCAPTSPAVKLHDETLTYLNQGQHQCVPGGIYVGNKLAAAAENKTNWQVIHFLYLLFLYCLCSSFQPCLNSDLTSLYLLLG